MLRVRHIQRLLVPTAASVVAVAVWVPSALAAEAGPKPGGGDAGEVIADEFTDDLVILKSDLAIEGKVVGRDSRTISVRVPYGVLSIPCAAVKRIEYNLTSRLGELDEEDYEGRYKVLAQALEGGNSSQTKRLMKCGEELVGKPGVPPDIYRLLAGMYESEGELKKALAHWKKYALARPRDEEAKKRIAELAERLGVKPGGQPRTAATGRAPAAGKARAARTTSAGGKPGGKPGVKPEAKPEAKPGVKAEAKPGVKPEVKPEEKPGEATPDAPQITEGLEAGGRWEALAWGNSAKVTIQALDGNKVVMVEIPAGGTKDKAAVQRQGMVDLSNHGRLAFRAFNGEKTPVNIAVALVTSKDYFESRTVRANPDWNMDLSVDLRGKQWKSQATKWTFRTEVQGLESVRQIILLIYSGRRKALLYFDYIHAE